MVVMRRTLIRMSDLGRAGPRRVMSRGQASVEYVAAVAVVALVLAGAGVALAAPDLPGAVAGRLRLALCIVGGDVCRRSDAAARGLEPCLVSGEEHERETGISFLFIRGSGSEVWAIERLSDGRIRLSAGYGQGLAASTGIGAEVGPVRAGGSASGGLGFRAGRTWELPGEAALKQLLARVHGYDLSSKLHTLAAMFPPPTETYLEGGGSAGAELAVEALREFPGGGAEARAALGRRTGSGDTTFYFELAGDGAGRIVAEYATGSPPTIALRTGDAEVETVMRLRLDDPADRAAAMRVAFVAVADPGRAIEDLVARIRARGTVERLRYRVRSDERAWAYGLGALLEVGADRSAKTTTRELVDAQVVNGRFPAERRDCLG
jgi:hypothetical protein